MELNRLSGTTVILASWARAIEIFNTKLTHDERKRIDPARCPRASFNDFLTALSTARSKAETGHSRCKQNIIKLCQVVNRYAVVGDLIMQHHAEYTSLAWGAFRFLLLFVIEENDTTEKLTEGLQSVVHVMLRAEEYTKLFSAHSRSSTEKVFGSLQENLTLLYAEVLNFLIRATEFFKKSSWRRYVSAGISPFRTKFTGLLNQIDILERCVERDIKVLRVEADIQDQEIKNGKWLKHVDFSVDLQNLVKDHLAGTSSWFLTKDAYKKWLSLSSSSNLLRVTGKAGCGKSTLSAQVVRDLKSAGDSIVVYVRCKDREDGKSDYISVLRNVAYQILEQSAHSKEFHQMILVARLNLKTKCVESMDKLWAMIEEMLSAEEKVHCIIDGTDECSDSNPADFFAKLTEMFCKAGPKAGILVTSRVDSNEMEHHVASWDIIQVQPIDVQDDIKSMVLHRISTSPVLRDHPKRDFLSTTLINESDGMMLWAKLMLDQVEEGHWDVANLTDKYPRTLSGLYTATLVRIVQTQSQNRVCRLVQILGLVAFSARPLRLDELALAIAIISGLDSLEYYDRHRDIALRDCREMIGSLRGLAVTTSNGTVQIAHNSVKEYLLGSDLEEVVKGGNYQIGIFLTCSQNGHDLPANAALSYLLLVCPTPGILRLTSRVRFEMYPFLEYASRWVIHHVTRCRDDSNLPMRLADFFRCRSGGIWLSMVANADGISFGHLQLLQFQLKQWSENLSMSTKDKTLFATMLISLGAQRYLDCSHSAGIGTRERLDAMSFLATAYFEHGILDKAEALQRTTVQSMELYLGEECLETLSAKSDLSCTLVAQGRWDEAEKLQVHVREIARRLFDPDDPNVIGSDADLAATYCQKGLFEKAELLESSVLAKSKKIFGPEHPDTLTAMIHLSITYRNMGEWKEAETMQQDVMKARTKLLGKDHPKTLSAISNLATTYIKQERFTEAEKLLMHVTTQRKCILGESHPEYLDAVAKLATVLMDTGRSDEAESHLLKAVKLSGLTVGNEHPNTLLIQSNLAAVYSRQERWDEARDLHLQAMEMIRKVWGDEHPQTAVALANLAAIYANYGLLPEAEALVQHVTDIRSRLLGINHPDTLVSVMDLVKIYRLQDRMIEAHDLDDEVMRIYATVFGRDSGTPRYSTMPLVMSPMLGIATISGAACIVM